MRVRIATILARRGLGTGKQLVGRDHRCRPGSFSGYLARIAAIWGDFSLATRPRIAAIWGDLTRAALPFEGPARERLIACGGGGSI
jgi:hypothetical protein